MGLVKRTYVDGETVITADNLNDIQDAIIQNEEDITTKGTYSKPTGGIPKTDLASAVQTSLGKADTALQSSDIDNTLAVAGKAADAKKTGDEISGLKNTLTQMGSDVTALDGAKASKADLVGASLILTGSTNTTGETIYNGTVFYLNGILVKATLDILDTAPFTENTNYIEIENGGLNIRGFIIKRVELTRNIPGGEGTAIYLQDIATAGNIQLSKISGVVIEGVRPDLSWTAVTPFWFYNAPSSNWGVYNAGSGGTAIIDFLVMVNI